MNNESNNMIITMPKFLYDYLGIEDINIFKITHEDLKVLMPEVKRYSFEKLERDYSLVYQGDIILVKDIKGKLVPYYNPLKYLEIEIKDLDEIQKNCIIKEQEELDIENFTNYELKKEYFKDRKLHKYKLCRVLKKEIEKRNIDLSRRKCKKYEKYKGDVDYD